jgi:hypothetical protein
VQTSRLAVAIAWAGLLLITSRPALAHKPSDSYLTITIRDAHIDVRWDIALRDLDNELGLDANDDGLLTWGEVRRRQTDVDALVWSQLHISANGERCRLARSARPPFAHSLDTHSDGTYDVVEFALDCSRVPTLLGLEYRLFANSDPTHRGILRLRESAGLAGFERAAVLGPDQPIRSFVLGRNAWADTLREFVVQGIWHIWLGFDHILFLLALLLSSVLARVRDEGTRASWAGVPRLRPALIDVLKVVTGFTVAHSITLTLAVLGWVSLPTRLVESAIAATVLLAALNNLYPLMRERRWLAAFGFGLIHGFGFAGALKDLGLPPGALGISLFGFNLGVEIGQLALVSVFLPVAFALRSTTFYRRGVLRIGSAAIAILALIWLLERAFDLRLTI